MNKLVIIIGLILFSCQGEDSKDILAIRQNPLYWQFKKTKAIVNSVQDQVKYVFTQEAFLKHEILELSKILQERKKNFILCGDNMILVEKVEVPTIYSMHIINEELKIICISKYGP